MTNSEYWIYSDGNAGQAILARCEGTVFTPPPGRALVIPFFCIIHNFLWWSLAQDLWFSPNQTNTHVVFRYTG